MAHPEQFVYSYSDIIRLTGLTKETVYQHKTRGFFDPTKLESVFFYICEQAVPDIQDEIVERAMRGVRDRHRSQGGGNKSKPKKKAVRSSKRSS